MTYRNETLPLHGDEKMFTWWQVAADAHQAMFYVVAALLAEVFCIEAAMLISKSFGNINGITLGILGSCCLLFLLCEYLKGLKSVVGRCGRCLAMILQAMCMVAIELTILGRLALAIDKKICRHYRLPFSVSYPCQKGSSTCSLDRVPVPCGLTKYG